RARSRRYRGSRWLGVGRAVRPGANPRGARQRDRYRRRIGPAGRSARRADRHPRLPRVLHSLPRCDQHGRGRGVRRARLQRPDQRADPAHRRDPRASAREPRAAAPHHGERGAGAPARCRARGRHGRAAGGHPWCALRGPDRGGGQLGGQRARPPQVGVRQGSCGRLPFQRETHAARQAAGQARGPTRPQERSNM
ncbi:hypothetical protein CRE_29409, partial [Caenorhabditis remanei]